MDNNQELANELYKPARKNFATRHVLSDFPDDVWSIDLADMNDVIKYNHNYRYMVNCVDCFSRFAWSVPVKQKTGPNILAALQLMVKENKDKYPMRIWVDQGSEFYNEYVKKWCDDYDISMYSTIGRAKSAVVERFNRTIKSILYKHFFIAENKEWVSILPEMMKQYNDTPHKGIGGLTPTKAHNLKDDEIRYLYDYERREIPQKNVSKPIFKVGDHVRLSRVKSTFAKGYHQSWTTKVYIISKLINSIPWTYNIVDSDGDEYMGGFYEKELQLTTAKPE